MTIHLKKGKESDSLCAGRYQKYEEQKNSQN
jgi:hypothetical protein